MHLELTAISRVPTFLTFKVIPYFDPELYLRHLHRYVLGCARGSYNVGVESLCWSGFPLWVITGNGLLIPDVWVSKTLLSFLRVSLALQFFPRGEPLIRFEGYPCFLYLGCPSCSVMDDLRFGYDEVVFPCPFVLSHQPLEVSEPHIPCDFLYVL